MSCRRSQVHLKAALLRLRLHLHNSISNINSNRLRRTSSTATHSSTARNLQLQLQRKEAMLGISSLSKADMDTSNLKRHRQVRMSILHSIRASNNKLAMERTVLRSNSMLKDSNMAKLRLALLGRNRKEILRTS